MAIFTDVFEDVTKQGRKIPTSDYHGTGVHPIIDQGQSAIAGYTDETDGLFTDVPAIIFGDHTRVLKYVDTPCFLGADGVKLLKTKIANPNYKYLYYVLSNANIPNTGYNRHFKWLKEVNIPLPNVDEQQKIVDTLDKIGELITLRKEQLAKLDQLVKSRFIELFGNTRDNEKDWSMVSLKSVAEVRGRVGWKGYKKEDLRESGPLVLGATHLTESGCIDLSAPVYLSREKYEESPEIMLQKNDLIFTQRGNTIGKVGLVEDDIGEATINPCVLILRPLAINPIYFKTYFIMNETKSDMWSLNAGSAQPMITQKGIGEYMLMLPPIELQNQFAAFVKQTDKSKLAIQQSLDKLELLKKSLMQEYFG